MAFFWFFIIGVFVCVERQGKVPYSNVVTGLWRALVSRHRGRHRLPAASRRRLASLSYLQPASLQHHRGDYRTEIQQVCLAAQFGDIRLKIEKKLPFLNIFFPCLIKIIASIYSINFIQTNRQRTSDKVTARFEKLVYLFVHLFSWFLHFRNWILFDTFIFFQSSREFCIQKIILFFIFASLFLLSFVFVKSLITSAWIKETWRKRQIVRYWHISIIEASILIRQLIVNNHGNLQRCSRAIDAVFSLSLSLSIWMQMKRGHCSVLWRRSICCGPLFYSFPFSMLQQQEEQQLLPQPLSMFASLDVLFFLLIHAIPPSCKASVGAMSSSFSRERTSQELYNTCVCVCVAILKNALQTHLRVES